MEQRREKRLNLFYYFDVKVPDSGEILGHLENITHNGLKFLSSSKHDIAAMLRLEIPIEESLHTQPIQSTERLIMILTIQKFIINYFIQ